MKNIVVLYINKPGIHNDINVETLLILITDGDRRAHRQGARGKKYRRRARVGGLCTYDTRC